jgi:hypothetical protein
MADQPSPSDFSVYAPPKIDERPPRPPGRARPPLFFSVSPVKLLVMSIATFGVYEIFWFFANWQRMKKRGQNVSPFWRTLFATIFCYSLFKTVKETATSSGIPARFSPGFLAVGWIVTTLMWRLPDPGWLVANAAVLFLLPVQKSMTDVNEALYPGHDPNARFTAWNVAAIAFGAVVFVLVAWQLITPP